ncbi:MAG: hypothetical protein QXQ11_06835 [Candidatus Bathyarchaeia archaeon]
MGRIKVVRKISVRLTEELAEKLSRWESFGFSLSDTVRHAISILPDSPSSLQGTEKSIQKIKSLRKGSLEVKLRDEKDALRALQEW